MDLTSSLLRSGGRRPHVLVAPAVGATAARLAIERVLAARMWPIAASPADTDLLVVAGEPGPDLTAALARVWRQVPSPRARVDVIEPAGADAALDHAATRLVDLADQRAQRNRPAPNGGGSHGSPMSNDETHQGQHSGHGEHGGMELPGGLPMAELAEDRDGLRLDRLHLPLGPVLPDWPAGLVVRVVLQGDVIQAAEVEVLDRGDDRSEVGTFWVDQDRATARELDALARFLSVAGWGDAAARARSLRDHLLAGNPGEHRRRTARLIRRIRRSRTLRWLLNGIAAGSVDAVALLEQRLAAVEATLGGSNAPGWAPAHVESIPGMLAGVEFAAARLVIALVDPETEARAGARYG